MSTSDPAPADAAPPEGPRGEGPRGEGAHADGQRAPGRRRGARAGRGAGRRTQDGPRDGRTDEGRGPERSSRERAPRHDAGHRPRRDDARLSRTAEARAAVTLPPIVYPEQLPVSARREEIAAALRDHQVVVVAGETGSGKTTQIPKIALELGRGRAGQIGHTQPRRIAARTVAERIADELNVPLGGVVGYQVRFTDESSDSTLVKVMTDGILLAQIQRDPMLRMYDTLIIDEAHERSLNIDFILGYLTRLLPQRPDLKLVITSATIDSDRFARHFAGPPTAEHPDGVPAPVVEVSGRTYPVEIRYQPLSPDDGPDRDMVTGITEAVDELMAEGPGDILVFLSGEREIRDAEDALRGSLGPRVDPKHPNGVDIVPLYARLSAAEQRRVFEPHTRRRVILATNVAETSLTVPGVRYVVDPGTARISRFSKATKVQRLPIEPISQASANQRSGRSGRVAPGIAIRLYSQEDFESRPEYTEPEILRTSLASVILQMIAVGVVASPDEVVDFPFVDPPDVRSVRDGVGLLTELHALEEVRGRTRLTETGRQLAQLPIDPRLARMVVEAGRRGVAREVVVIAAALSIQDPRERPAESRETADALHRRFADPSSDLLTYLNLWTYLRDRQRELSGSAFRRMCKSEHLHYLRVREWQDVVTQLREMAKGLGVHAKGAPTPTSDVAPAADGHGRDGRRDGGRHTPTGAPTQEAGTVERPDAVQTRWTWDADTIHRAMLPGLLSQIGMQLVTDVAAGNPPKGRDGKPRKPDARARNEYLGARGARFAIFPGSGLSRKPPSWVMAAELVETSRLWARDVAKVDPAWVEEAAAHLVKRTFSEPAWSTRQGAAMVNEKVLLYGVPVVAQRRVLLAKTDPEQARELFVRHALVQGEWTTHHKFFHENRRLLDEAEALEARARRRDLVVDDDALFDFYDARIPPEVVSARHFDTWWKVAKRADPDLLSFTRELLVGDDAAEIDEHAFPSRWPQGELSFPLTYQFEPGTEADGVTIHIPISQLPRVRPEGFDWMVPGMRAELLTATIRALPKPVRVQLVPAPDVARAVDAWLAENSASWADTVRAGDAAPSFREMFARAVRALRDVEVPADAVDEDRLPPHLRMTFRVVGDRGGVIDEGKDLLALQRRLADRAQDAVSSAVRTAVRAAMEQAAAQAGTSPPAPTQPTPTQPTPTQPTPTQPSAATPTPGARVQSSHAPGAPARSGATPDLERTGLTTWPDLPALPDVIEARTPAGGLVRAYPTLVEEGSGARATVALRVLADAAVAQAAARRGLRRLLLLDVGLATPRVTSRWTGTQALALAASPYPSTDALVADVQLASIDRLIARHLQGRTPRDIRDADAYAALRGAVRDALEDDVHRVVGDLVGVLSAWRELDSDVRATSSLALLATAQDVREQAAALVHDGFVSRVGADRLPQLVRYLRAARHRLAKAADNPTRDADLAWQVHDVEQLYTAARERAATAPPDPARDAALDDVRWLLEELRVSLFAQQLGTPVPVSPTRIRKALAAIGA
ncbi:ATP-dependent RNA helicase HrpA [Cellulomonas xiejunii]|uniref:ATP-dependent RNA helicase HrpA n=1 Tax=Cellulomonas xiejunii TaxID=2968083 RepID=A0ABY5KQD5_9CELL|nr:ATP-dependent RNA helicase HrpA [Cellulomonas xiejunii]MCC2321423.1 ATP-dependent RNA helicase HrpA [Cellulomonas xiejunii]MCC2323425.1 ATP-dependent RNA helicase HrpA [Cellulomonas xiejunii]UUI72000.1 ATP-dependent RNA helicase HrpA [Cellulomonas xiejunii]